MRDLTIEGKIVIFKLFAISKIVHLALIKTVPTFGKEKKIKHSTLCSSYENVDLKDVDIFYIK